MSEQVRVRFAPSPTGPLHIGGVRTALYNYIFARQNGGKMILRIEDTDSQRFVPGAEDYINSALDWLGIRIDEGVREGGPYGPYKQSERRDIYREHVKMLLDAGKAYIAFDTPEELEAKRNSVQNFQYDASTRMQMRNSLSMPAEEVKRLIDEGHKYVVRFKVEPGRIVEVDDILRDKVHIKSDILDDKVLYKSADDLPTYHLANIVDDHLMKISHVIRGEEWLPSAPLHVLLYEAFGWQDTMPRFAHLSLLLKPDGKGKLSKRDGDRLGFPVFPLKWVNAEGEVSRGYREDGYFPEAFVNMLAMLGWNPGDDRELFTMDELIQAFSLERVVMHGAKFNPEKAKWYNKEYLRKKSDHELTKLFKPVLKQHGLTVHCPKCAEKCGVEYRPDPDFATGYFPKAYVQKVVSLIKERATFVADFWDIASYLFVAPKEYVEKDVAKFWKSENVELALQVAEFIKDFADKCGKDGFTKETLEGPLEEYIRGNEWPMGKVMNCLRLALVGASSGLGIADIVTLLGRDEFASRIDAAVANLGK